MDSTNIDDQLSIITGLPKDTFTTTTANNTPGPGDDLLAALGSTEKAVQMPSTTSNQGYLGTELASRNIDVSNKYTDPLSNYVDYGVPLNPFSDWNDMRARNQSTMQKIGYGTIKGISTFTGAVAENTLGIFAGLGSMMMGGTYADNIVGNTVDSTNEWLAENLPHYQTAQELERKQSGSTLGALGTANFWTDTFLNGIAYSLGSVATIELTGGSGFIGKGIQAGGKALGALGTASKIQKLTSTGESLKNIYNVSKMIKTGTKLTGDISKFATMGKVLNAVNHLEMATMMSLAEASVEAREKSKLFTEEMFAAWEGRPENYGKSAETDMTAEEKKAIFESAKGVENFTFGWNMPILMGTNALMFGSMIRGKAGKSFSKGVTEKVVSDGEKYAAKLPKTMVGKAFSKAYRVSSPVLKNGITEMVQEGAQTMIGSTAVEYFKNKFNTGTEDMSGAMIKGMMDTYGTSEGVESMLTGFLVGAIMGGASNIGGSASKNRKAKAVNTANLISIANSGSFTNIVAGAEQNLEINSYMQAIQKANAVGNYKAAEELRLNLIASRAMKLKNLDALDLAMTELDDLGAMSEKDFMERTGYDTTKTLLEQTGMSSHKAIVEDIKKDINDLAKTSDKLDNILSLVDPRTKGIGRLFETKENLQIEKQQELYNQRLKSILMTNMVSIKSRDREIDDAITDLRGLSEEFGKITKSSLLTVLKRNDVAMAADGNITMPNRLVNVSLTDKAAQGEREAKEATIAQEAKENTKKEDTKENNAVKTALDRAIEESKTFDTLKKLEFDQALESLRYSMAVREEAIAAFDELIKNPEKREMAIVAKQAAARRAAISNAGKEASKLIELAETTKDLDDIDQENLSPELIAALEARYEELYAIEEQYYNDYADFPDAVLAQLGTKIDEIEEDSPQKALALTRVIEDRKKGTKAEREKRQANKTPEQQAIEDEVIAALNSKNNTPLPDNPQNKPFENKIAIVSGDGRRLRINGVTYENTFLNPIEAITWDEETLGLKVGDTVEWEVTTPSATEEADAKVTALQQIKEEIIAATTAEEANAIAEKLGTIIPEEETAAWMDEFATGPEGPAIAEEMKAALPENPTQEDAALISIKILLPRFLDVKIAELTTGVSQTTGEAITKADKPVVKSVTLTNEAGQIVEFTAAEYPSIALEVAEVIASIATDGRLVTELELSEPELRKKLDIQYKSIEKLVEAAELMYNTLMDNIERATAGSIQSVMKKYSTLIGIISPIYSSAKAAYIELGKSPKEILNDEDWYTLRDIQYDLTQAIEDYRELQKVYRDKTNMAPVAVPTDAPTEFTSADEIEYQNEFGKLNADIDTGNDHLTDLTATADELQMEIDAGNNIEENSKELQETIDEIEVVTEDLRILNDVLNNLRQEYEDRKSSETSTDLQDTEGATEYSEKQGDQRETEGAVQVPTEEEPDVAEPEDIPFIIGRRIEEEDFGTTSVPNGDSSNDLIDEEEDETEEEEYIVDEDNMTHLNPTVAPEEQEKVEGDSGELDVRLLPTTYRYSSDFNHIIVDENGQPLPNIIYLGDGTEENPGRQQISTKTGKAIPVNSNALVSSELTPVNDGSPLEIVFEVRTDTVYFEKESKTRKPEDLWKIVPIYVTVRTSKGLYRVGMLEGYNPSKAESNSDRQTIWENYLKGNKVTSTLAGKRGVQSSQHIANALTESGTRFLYDITANGNKPIIVIAATDGGRPAWKVFLNEENVEVDTSAWRADTSDLGGVGMAVKTPTGGYKLLRLLTQPIGQTGATAVLDALKLGQAERISQIVGFNLIADAAISMSGKNAKKMIFEDVIGEGDNAVRTYVYWLPQAESWIRVSAEELGKALDKKQFKFQFIEISKEDGATKFAPDSTRKDWSTHYADVLPTFLEVIQEKRYQVDKEFLATNGQIPYTSPLEDSDADEVTVFDNYLDYLTDSTLLPELKSDSKSHTSILSSGTYINPETGSPYFNIGITFGPMMINGKALTSEESPLPPSPTVKIEIKETVVQEEEEFINEETEEETTTEENSSVDATNLLIDEDEEEEEEETMEEKFSLNKLFKGTESGDILKVIGYTKNGVRFEVQQEGLKPTKNLPFTELERLLKQGKLTAVKVSEEDEEKAPEDQPVTDIKAMMEAQGIIAEEEEEDEEVAEEDEIVNEPLAAVLEKIKETEYKGMVIDPITKEETHYKITPEISGVPDQFDRITRKTSEPFTGTKETQVSSSTAGTTTHSLVEDMLMKRDYVKPDGISAVAFLDLKSQAVAIEKIFKTRRHTIVSVEMLVYNEAGKWAGKFDILTKDNKGVYYIYDIKTGSESGLKNYEKGYTDPKTKKTKKSKRQQHGSQLSAYAYALRGHGIDNNIDVKVPKGSVLYIPIEYTTDGSITKVSKLAEKKFILSADIKAVFKGEVTFEYKASTKAEDPAVKNAGKRKGSTKSNAKSKLVLAEEEEEEEETKPAGKGIKATTKKAPVKLTKANILNAILNAKKVKAGDIAEGQEGMLGNIKTTIIDNDGQLDDEFLTDIINQETGLNFTVDEVAKMQEAIIKDNC
jgi:hypothetical protein